MKISITITPEGMPKWIYNLWRCRHEMVEITKGKLYSSQESWCECLHCGRDVMEAQDHCKHEPNGFGVCLLCNKRVDRFDCPHVNITDDGEMSWCNWCGDDFPQDYTEDVPV